MDSRSESGLTGGESGMTENGEFLLARQANWASQAKRRLWGIILSAQLASSWLGAGYAQGPGPPVFTVQVGSAVTKIVTPTLEFTASLEPWRTVDVSSEIEGLVISSPIEEGQVIGKGEIICQLDPERIEIESRRLQAMVDKAEADLDRLRTGYRTEEIEVARKNVEAARARHLRAKDDWERQRPLVQQGVLSRGEGIRTETLYSEAGAALESSESELALKEAGFRSEEIRSAEAEVAMRKAELADVTRQLAGCTITASTDGVIVERLKEPGEWVAEGDAVAQFVVLDPLRARIEVPQIHFAQIHRGQKALLTIDGLPGEKFKGIVEQIIPRNKAGTRNLPVLLRLENPGGMLTSGLFARALLTIGESTPVITVPREAILIREDHLVVLVADPLPKKGKSPQEHGENQGKGNQSSKPPGPDSVIRAVEVQTREDVGDRVGVQIAEGETILDGDRVVILGGSRLRTGMPVRVLESPDSEGSQRESSP